MTIKSTKVMKLPKGDKLLGEKQLKRIRDKEIKSLMGYSRIGRNNI